jgi:hypothetical protein
LRRLPGLLDVRSVEVHFCNVALDITGQRNLCIVIAARINQHILGHRHAQDVHSRGSPIIHRLLIIAGKVRSPTGDLLVLLIGIDRDDLVCTGAQTYRKHKAWDNGNRHHP